jgi:uncharacterized iron-regulated membrane protein
MPGSKAGRTIMIVLTVVIVLGLLFSMVGASLIVAPT